MPTTRYAPGAAAAMTRRAAIHAAAAPLLLGGCAAHIQDARLYDYNSGMLSSASFFDLENDHGRAEGQLFSGEHLAGEFTVTGEASDPGDLPRRKKLDFDPVLAAGKDTAAKVQALDDPAATLAAVFGFKPDTAAKPMAVATLVGDKGTVLEIVLYTLDVQRGTASGVAHDNKGNWYIVRMGND